VIQERGRPFLGVERSFAERVWRARATGADLAAAEALTKLHDVPDILARVLAARGVRPETLDDALDPTLRRLMPDPSTLTAMDAAAGRLADAAMRGEKVAIFGDYDVDGACSAALLAEAMGALGSPTEVHIPDRITEGYGPNVAAIEGFAARGAGLLVTVDCGTTSFEPLARAAALGLDAVVLDHHLADAELPPAVALVNPNRQDDLSGQGHLCAAGVTFLALVATLRELRRRGHFETAPEPDLMAGLDLVALATVADVVPLKGLNRAFVTRGLERMRKRERIGLRALADVARLSGPPEPYHLGFLIGPRINAGGRVGDAALGAKLLATRDEDEAARIAAMLDRLNRERQVIEQVAVEEAVAEAEAAMGRGAPSVLVTSGANWHPGVVGLVAARLKERFGRPAFALALADGAGEGVGSGRSIAGVDLGRSVRRAVERGVLVKGGGHAMAAGVTIARERLAEFRAFLETDLGDAVAAARADLTLPIDAALIASAATPDLVALIAKAGPFGSGVPEPVFAFPDHRVVFADVVGAGHVRVTLEAADRVRLKAVAFRSAETALGRALLESRGRAVHVAGALVVDRWQGEPKVEVRILDAARPAG
jgi:single-stranded-DNA-specific exonuclease